jgi:UDP-N-acetylglucosamine 2-epimerase (non-hydrolysing)
VKANAKAPRKLARDGSPVGLTLLPGRDGEVEEPAALPRLVHVVTSRSDLVALAPVAVALQRGGIFRQIVLLAAQGTDETLTDGMFREVGLPLPEHRLAAGAGSHGRQTARALERSEALLASLRPAAVLVPGASDAALGCAVAAAKLGVPVARLDAGLREHDLRAQAEINRVLMDTLADVCFAPTHEAAATLLAAGAGPARVHMTGSTAVDSVRRFHRLAADREVWRRFGIERGSYVLVTLSRPANVDHDEQLARIVEALAALAAKVPVVFPLHPTTQERLTTMGDAHRLVAAGVHCEPLFGYLDFLSLQAGAGTIVTDSGTVQEEASALGIRCFTLLASTERTITLTHGTNVLLGDDPRDIADVLPNCSEATPCAIPLWDGRAGERVAAELVANYALVRATSAS